MQSQKKSKAKQTKSPIIKKINELIEENSAEEDEEDTVEEIAKKTQSQKKSKTKQKKSPIIKKINKSIEEDSVDEDEEDSVDENEGAQHKKDLENLQKTDPEFYKFLQENDKKLLQFNLSDEEPEDDDDNATVHKPSGDLEVASDESDYEDDDKPKDNRKITLELLKKWQGDIQTDKTNKTITAVIEAFHAALQRVSSEQEDAYYEIKGSAVFNGVIQLCVMELGPAIRRFLGLAHGSKQPPHKCKKFVKVKRLLKGYFTDLLQLLTGVTSSNIQTVLLKHLHYMSTLLVSYPNLAKLLIKRLVHLWGSADDSVRVVAFFCILRITNNQQQTLLDLVLKSMYLTFVTNSKFVSLSTLPGINFMRRSLVEMYSLDEHVAYNHVFLYIRQLGIHLRNAITMNKKENVQAVYNWQFVNSLRLWGALLGMGGKLLEQLVYPFVQVCLGTIKLVPTAQFYPLRFHVVQVLMDLSKDTGVFVPILPFLTEVLTSYNFNSKHQRVSMKPLHFTCLLRLSKSQMMENGFKDSLIDTIYRQLLEYLAGQSHTVAFPDLSLICVVQIKQFLKSNKNSNYNKKMKQLLEKIEQNASFIEKERSKLSINITDFKQLEGWEAQIKNKVTPLAGFCESWSKLHNVKKRKQMTQNDELADYQLPKLKKAKNVVAKDDGPVELFPDDDDDEEEHNEEEFQPRGKRGSRKSGRKAVLDVGPVISEGQQDIVQDISEWE